MKDRSAIVGGALLASLGGLCCLIAAGPSFAQGRSLLEAERALTSAFAAGDASRIAARLHPELRWIDAAGVSVEVGGNGRPFPQRLIESESGAQTTYHEYGPVAVVELDRDKLHTLHVWVRYAGDWQLLVYQDVRSLDRPPTVTPGAGADCENPCRSVGMEPANDAQAAVIAAYEELETAAETRNADLWSSRIATEFVAASSNSDRLFDKENRLAGLRQSTLRGLSPTPLVSGRIYDFPGAAVMVSEHIPDRGKPLRVTRVWVKRDGRWVETLSYQTAVQSGAVAADRPGVR